MTFPPPSPPYLGPAAHTSPGSNKPINRIVIHSTVSPCREGQAVNTAAYFRSQAAIGSAHYVVDPGTVVQVVYDSVIAWHAPPNPHSLGVELCDMPGMGLAARLRWSDAEHRRTLRRAVRLVAQLCLAYDVPVEFLDPEALKAGKRGITTHANVSAAFHESTHWDPGDWPQLSFMGRVRRRVRQATRQTRRPDDRHPTPASMEGS